MLIKRCHFILSEVYILAKINSGIMKNVPRLVLTTADVLWLHPRCFYLHLTSFLWALFQILCRKSPGGTSGNFWWTQRGKWSASGGRTSPLTAFERRWRRWCAKSSWRNGWSYDEVPWWPIAQGVSTLDAYASRAGTWMRGLWTVTASAFWGNALLRMRWPPQTGDSSRALTLVVVLGGGKWARPSCGW